MNAACNREATVNDELSRQVRGVTRNGRSDRLTVQCARLVHDGVRIAALKTDGSLALAAHVMEGAEGLDAHRQDLADNDPLLNTILADVEATALAQVKRFR
jgi:hypothetical protein